MRRKEAISWLIAIAHARFPKGNKFANLWWDDIWHELYDHIPK